MTDKEVKERIDAITSASKEEKEAILKRFKHYQSSDDETRLTDAILHTGMINQFESRIIAVQQTLKLMKGSAHQLAAIQHVRIHDNAPYYVGDDDDITTTYNKIAELVSSYAYAVEYTNADWVSEHQEKARKAMDEALEKHNALVILRTTVRDMRDAQTTFYELSKKGLKGSKEWNDALRRSKMLELEVDKFLAASWMPKQENLFG